MKCMVIANPAAGKGSAKNQILRVEARLRSSGFAYSLTYTERPWHAAELAYQAAAQGFDIVASAGGDGTCNEVLNGLMRARQNGLKSPKLAVICIGRGNDFAFGTGIPTDWEAACDTLVHGSPHRIDVGFVSGDCLQEGRYFGNGIGIGFDAEVNVQATKTRLGGFPGYTVAALRTILLNFRAPAVQIDFDEATITQPSLMISIMNGKRMGGGFLMAPDGENDDGILDICLAHKVNRGTILMMIPRFMRGTQASHPAIRFARSKRVQITTLDGSLPIHIDGETVCTEARQLSVEILPGGMEIIR